METKAWVTTSLVLSALLVSSLSAQQWRLVRGDEQDIDLFLMPIDPSADGVQQYLETVYNAPAYAHDVLPYDFSHLAQFLELGVIEGSDRDYAKSILLLFKKKMAESPCISGYMAVSMVNELTSFFSSYLADGTQRLLKKDAVKRALYKSFVDDFQGFQQNPKQFFDQLAGQVVENLDDLAAEQPVSTDHLTLTLVRFIDTLLGKVMWDVEDEQLWESVAELGEALNNLYRNTPTLHDDDFNDLLWTLIYRFAYIVELAGGTVPIPVFEAMRDDIELGQSVLVSFEELEQCVTSKREFLSRVMVEGRVRAYAIQEGIIA